MKTFSEFLNEQEQGDANTPKAKEVLKEFADSVADFVGPPAKCDIVLGGILNDGQEYRAVLSFPPLDYAQTLFRAFISLNDNTIAFHPTGGVIERKVDDLRERLMKFLQRPALVETLQYLKEKARQFRDTGKVS